MGVGSRATQEQLPINTSVPYYSSAPVDFLVNASQLSPTLLIMANYEGKGDIQYMQEH
jgi:hypothetical protein